MFFHTHQLDDRTHLVFADNGCPVGALVYRQDQWFALVSDDMNDNAFHVSWGSPTMWGALSTLKSRYV